MNGAAGRGVARAGSGRRLPPHPTNPRRGWLSPFLSAMVPALTLTLALTMALTLALTMAPGFFSAAGAATATPPKYAGTYRIESWRNLEAKGFFHFFYLQPGGAFLLGAEWPGMESSRAAGVWHTSGERLILDGRARVSTNQGKWRVPFRRSYRIAVSREGIRLTPIPEKNRYGLLGWPNAYTFYLSAVAPNLPAGGIPTGEAELRTLIEKIAAGKPGKP